MKWKLHEKLHLAAKMMVNKNCKYEGIHNGTLQKVRISPVAPVAQRVI
jgi:hypothetical protein